MNTKVETRREALVAWCYQNHHVLSLLLLLALFGPLLWLSQYNYPSGDDYLAFFQASTLGPFAATRWWYRYWSGRYSYFFLQSLFPDHAVWLTAYRVIPIVLFVAGFWCLLAFVRALLGPGVRNRELVALTAGAYVFLVSLTPEIATAFYWMSTNVRDAGAVFTTLLLLALYIDLGRARTLRRRCLYWLTAILLIVLLAGLNEISISLFIAVMASINVVRGVRFGKPSPRGLVFLVCSLLFASLAFLAPGNSIRAEYTVFKEAPLITITVSAARFTLDLLVKLLTATPLLLVSALYFVFLERHRDGLSTLFAMLAKVRWHWILLLLFVTFTSVTVGLFAAAGIHPVPDRIKNVYVYSLVLSWFFFVTVLFVDLTSAGVRLPAQHGAVRVLSLAIGIVVLVFLVTGFKVTLTRGNDLPTANDGGRLSSTISTRSVYANAYLDIVSGRATAYASHNREVTRRYRAANGECVVFPPLSSAPDTIVIQFVKYPWRWCPREHLRRFQLKHGTSAYPSDDLLILTRHAAATSGRPPDQGQASPAAGLGRGRPASAPMSAGPLGRPHAQALGY